MQLADVVATSQAVAATSSRTAKSAALVELLVRLDPTEIEPTVGFLVGEARQGRIGVGWKSLQKVDPSGRDAGEADPLTVIDVDQAISDLAALGGAGSGNERTRILTGLFRRATTDERRFLTDLLRGELRQGALAGVMTDAVAKASSIPAAVVRRAVMFGGRLDTVARLALTDGRPAVEAVGLEVGRPVQPMLASTAASPTEAIEAIGSASVEWKLDGIRIQVHRNGDEISVWTRNLNDITERVPELVAAIRALPATSLVVDGEALVTTEDGRPVMFQDTAGRIGTEGEHPMAALPHLFDLLHLDGRDLVDEPLAVRRAELERIAPDHLVQGAVTDDPAEAEQILVDALDAGHEGVVVKDAASPYLAGRRGKAWRKVKPVHTVDLVVLAVEWGYGRRTGWLSNLHLGARADDGDGDGDEFVMVGKTFKGMTDEMLRWQTDRFLELAEREEPWNGPQTGTVRVHPEQVVEIALDGVQRSTTYAGGVALRFARVLRYRDDKGPGDADSITALRSLLPG